MTVPLTSVALPAASVTRYVIVYVRGATPFFAARSKSLPPLVIQSGTKRHKPRGASLLVTVGAEIVSAPPPASDVLSNAVTGTSRLLAGDSTLGANVSVAAGGVLSILTASALPASTLPALSVA